MDRDARVLRRAVRQEIGALRKVAPPRGFAHLDVSNNYLTKDGIRVLEQALPNAHVIVGKQREDGDYGRYVTLGE